MSEMSQAAGSACARCGVSLAPEHRFCPACGAPVGAVVAGAVAAGAGAAPATTKKPKKKGYGCLVPALIIIGLVLVAGLLARPSSSGGPDQAAPSPTEAVGAAAAPATGSTAQPATAATAAPATGSTARPATAAPAPTATRPAAPTATAVASIAADTWPEVLRNPDGFKGRAVTIAGRVFTLPTKDGDRVRFQIYTTDGGREGNTVVLAPALDAAIKPDAYVRVGGVVQGRFSGANAFGGTISAPVIDAKAVERVSRGEAVAPAYESIVLDQTLTQHGLAVTLLKVELAQDETRVHVRVKNGSGQKASAYDYSAVIVQDGKQLKRKTVFNSGEPEVDDTLQPGTTTEGVILFEPVNQHVHLFRLVWPGVRTDNYRLDFADYVWEVRW
ncbi:MAG: hypothetical protein IT340_00275 [Chloroflexi bacterium]|nr:hypothetical protein [Chloroflexota bacterium]